MGMNIIKYDGDLVLIECNRYKIGTFLCINNETCRHNNTKCWMVTDCLTGKQIFNWLFYLTNGYRYSIRKKHEK